ncbi:isoflavone reductase [Fusarium sporotrichioides]|uniref:Isoflavone reductase n=1 Tax=Fusarium sporotrichioides TaxID=5514 RepID=A0A395SID0_FUSSP|nr:isoflavone reductase [Fusarium sporotrichioides]
MKVAIVGATGATGASIVNGLLESDIQFDITALVRPNSIEKSATVALKEKGIRIVAIDLQGNQDELVAALKGIDIVISAIYYQALQDEIPLSTAAKAAGVKRYVPCFFATIAPRGVMKARDDKEEILDHIQRIYLPYTVIDVGWWYQITLPAVPSGKFDGHLTFANNNIIGGGNNPSALVNLNDIGRYVAVIINDERTINKKIFAYTESKTQNEIFELVEKVTSEKPERTEVSYIASKRLEQRRQKLIVSSQMSKEKIEAQLAQLKSPDELLQQRAILDYWMSWGVRGDNTADNAVYLGYVLAKDLYPSLKGQSLEDFIGDVLDGKVKPVY